MQLVMPLRKVGGKNQQNQKVCSLFPNLRHIEQDNVVIHVLCSI